jgi:hypothetical protein
METGMGRGHQDWDRPDGERPELRLIPGDQDEEEGREEGREEAVARSRAAHPAGSAREKEEDPDSDA